MCFITFLILLIFKVILEDVNLLKIKPDMFTYTSDYFNTMLDMCKRMLLKGQAYVDSTDGDTMRLEREQMIESVYRNNCKYLNYIYFLLQPQNITIRMDTFYIL